MTNGLSVQYYLEKKTVIDRCRIKWKYRLLFIMYKFYELKFK